MNKIFFFFLISSIALAANSCGKDDEPFFSIDNTAPVIAEVTAVTTPTNDSTPNYTFSSTEAGAIAYGGSCSSSTMSAEKGNNTITLYSLSDDTYSDCTIKVTDTTGNESNLLTLSTFYVDSTASTLVEITAVSDSTNDNTPDYTFVSSEAGTITFSGACSSSTTSAIAGSNTITFNTLSDGTYSDCKITITDSLGNAVTLNIGSFVIDTTAPAVSSISPTDNQSEVAISENISVTFSEAIDNTSVTTNTDNTTCYGSFQLSADNFSSCVQMSSGPISSNSNKTFTVDPVDNLSFSTNYKIRVTTGVKDSAVNTLSSQFQTSNGYTTSGLFVAVGFSGTILTSSGGTSWDNRTSGTTENLYGITYDNGTFVTLGTSGTILSSSNGITWDNRTSGTSSTLWEVTYANSAFILVGDSGTILSSSNGTSWDNRTSGTTNILYGVTNGNSTLVTVGDNGTILTSSDGTSWNNRTSGTINKLYGVSYGNSVFLAVGDNGTILSSSDGTSWDNRTSGTSFPLKGVTSGNNIFVALGESGTLLSSLDGITWTSRDSGTSDNLSKTDYGNNTFVVVGDSGTILTSSDGSIWDNRTSGTSNNLIGISYTE